MARHRVWRTLTVALLVGAACAPAATTGRAPADPTTGASAGQAAAAANLAPIAPSHSPQLQALIDAARAEGQLALVMGGIDIPEELQRLADGFNRTYGLNLQVQFTPNPNMPETASKLVQEFRASRPASTDVFLGSESHIAIMRQAGALEAVDWPSWAPNVQNPNLLAPDGVAVELVTRTPGITYNTAQVRGDLVPATMQDLLKPQLKGRVASTPYAGAFTNLASPELWGEAKVKDYVTRFSDQLAGIMGCGEGQRIANGEFDLFALDCGSAEAARYRAQGAPMAHVIPRDGAILVYWWLAVPRHAPHPNAAKLWINYLLGREAQDVVYEYEYFDHHLVPGSKSATAIQQLQAQGVQFTEIDVDWSERYADQVVRLRNEIQNVLQKKS